MKISVISLLLSFFHFASKAQNGGQWFQNNVIRIEHLGYSAGTHTFKVVNKQDCSARIRTKADQDPAIDVQIPGKDSVYVNVFREIPNGVLFRAKAETACVSRPDMGWLEINTSNTTLHLDETEREYIREKKNMSVRILGGRFIKIETGNDIHYNLYIRTISPLGVEIFSQKRKIHKSAEIDMGYNQRGLLIIRVVIENGPSHVFTFKTFVN